MMMTALAIVGGLWLAVGLILALPAMEMALSNNRRSDAHPVLFMFAITMAFIFVWIVAPAFLFRRRG